MNLENLYEKLKRTPKKALHVLIYQLIADGLLEYHEITEIYIKHLQRLKQGQTEAYQRLQNKIMDMWCDKKKNIPQNLKSAVQLLKDEGKIMVEQEEIDNY